MILDNELYKLLQQSPKKNGKHTHTIPGKGAYFIEKENLDEFYKLVHKNFSLIIRDLCLLRKYKILVLL